MLVVASLNITVVVAAAAAAAAANCDGVAMV
jgi:hypothetical protein